MVTRRHSSTIGISAAGNTDYMSGKGYSILITGHLSMILAVGAIFRFGSRRSDEEKTQSSNIKAES